ncbi:MAG: YbjN domain-containing protein [Muribaculaceae bacterium]|nr:YbjN domain-containing protein [Muribaculaceae bacterium]
MRIRKKKTTVTADFEQFLKDNNCTYDIEHEDNATIYHFEFQAAHFVAAIRKQNDCVEVTYPTMASAPMSHLDLVRTKCNERNNSNILFKFTYSIDHEDNVVNVHMSFFNNQVTTEQMVNQLKAAFHFQREWHKDYDEAVSIAKDNDTLDLESELYKHQREMFMLRRLEMRHQLDSSAASIAAGTGTLPLWQMLETVSPLPQALLLFMTVNTVSGQERIEKVEDIRNYDLRRALVEGEGQKARLTRDYAILDLHYKQGDDQQPRMTTIALTAEGADDHSIYTRVTVTHVPRNASRMNSLNNENRQPHSVSLLIALDRSDDKKRQQEFDYMWSDAKLKARNGEYDSLSEEQFMLGQVFAAHTAYNLYWGQQLFHAGRYYEAILHLENVFNSLRENFFEMKSQDKQVFMETAYKLGFCYNELGLPKQAFYYLDLMASDGNIRHTMELVNSMANSKDLRLFSYTEGVMDEVKHNFSEMEELPENIKDFINFLRRRRGYAYIDFNQLDKAEKIFTQMLDEEDNADYAINELAYIKKLRQQRGENTSPEQDNELPCIGPTDGPPF